jgi:hypothetical protein
VSFQDWCNWAHNQPDDSDWPHVASIAAADAKYEDKADQRNFQSTIGDEHPQEKKAYREICWKYPLTGAPVSGTPPQYLTRCKEIEKLRSYNRELVRRTGDRDRRNHPTQYQPSGFSASEWQSVADAFDLAPEYQSDDFYAAYSTGTPNEKCVFATPQNGDDEPPSDEHTPQFYRTIQIDQRADETEADCAVYRLALDSRGADQADDYVLLYYPRTNIEDDSCFYPVPPDAGTHPLFKPVSPRSSNAFGRTCPGPLGNCNDARSEPELVHPNVPLTPSNVWIRPLDNENPAS